MIDSAERLRRWRLILGAESADSLGVRLSGDDDAIDQALGALYEAAGNDDADARGKPRSAGLGGSAPRVARWLGDVRKYFPSSVVRVMQRDALERLNLKQMLLEPEFLDNVQPDVKLAATLVALNGVMPQQAKAAARGLVRRVVDDLEKRLAQSMRQAVTGSLNRAARNTRPRHSDIDWHRTIRANLKHYLPEYKTIVPERRIGFGRKQSSLRDIVLCIDQSGSMATSVVYASVFGAVLASLRSVSTRMVVFDTAVVDLSDKLADPVEVLFGVQLGGGTDINQALGYCQSLMRRPNETIFILISDLYEGGNNAEMLRRAAQLVASGAQVISLLALDDNGAPVFDHRNAAAFAALGIPTFACTPDVFPELMAAAINRHDIARWAATRDIVLTRGQSD